MNDAFDITVSICTYNRCRLLAQALERVLTQKTDGARYEVIVADNNSSDETKQVVEQFIARGHGNLRYVFEGTQGLSFARNRTVACARSPILALTDDDVQVESDWIATIKRSLDAHPEVDWIGGKVLPRWMSPPPSWLTQEHWAPLALVDYGDSPFYVTAAKQICLISANLAIRRAAIEDVGLFLPALQRVQNIIGSMEDHELQVRLWRAGRQGMYVPTLTVTTEVPLERMSKAYHRRWHLGHGYFYALARLEEMEASQKGRLFDVASHVYKRAFADSIGWLASVIRGNLDRAFLFESRLAFFLAFFSRRYRDFSETRQGGNLREVIKFVRSWAKSRGRFGDVTTREPSPASSEWKRERRGE